MTKSIFLTGANGFLGSFLARALAMEGWEVKCLLRSQKGELAHERLNKAISSICVDHAETRQVLARCTVLEGELDKPRFGLEQDSYDKLAEELDSVLHCAAMTTFDPAHEKRQWKVNVDGQNRVYADAWKLPRRGDNGRAAEKGIAPEKSGDELCISSLLTHFECKLIDR